MAKKITKKETVVEEKAVTLVTANLPENALNSSAMASLANYDMAQFQDVALDVVENKDLFKNDIIIPKLWLIQAMSDLRKAKKADEGEYVDSRSEEILLPFGAEYLPLIVIKTFKRWQTFKLVNKGTKIEKVFVSSEIMVLGKNENLAYQFSEEGVDHVRRQVISAYVLLGDDAQKGVIKPYIIDFASTSKGAGRDLVSDIKTLNGKKLPSFVGWFKLGKGEETRDDNTYFIKTCKFGGFLPPEMLPFLKEAYVDITSMIDNNTIEIDDRDVHDAAKTPTKDDSNVTAKALNGEAGI